MSVKINIVHMQIKIMLPDKCSVAEEERRCIDPPEFIVSVVDDRDEYMVGVTCARHKKAVSDRIKILQSRGKVREGEINITPVRPVGTDCIRGNEDDLVHIEMKDLNSKTHGC